MPTPLVSLPKKRLDELEEVLGEGNYRRIANWTGYTNTHISRVLRGATQDVTMGTAYKIAKAVGVSLDELNVYILAKRGERAA